MIERQLFYSTIISLVILVFLFGNSCGLLNGEDNKKESGELMPLAVGNWWEYEATYLDVLKDTIRYEVTAEIEVPVGDATYTAYAANFLPFPPDLEPYFWLRRNGEQGIYSMGGISKADTLFMNEVEYKFPSEVGETIQSPQVSFSYDRFEFYLSDTLSITLVDDGREIDTPAGKFNCFVYKFTVSNGDDVPRWDYYLYYRTGVGLVAQIATSEDEPENIKQEMYLMNYKVN